MNIITQLLESTTLSEVKQIERKYYSILPDNQKWNLMNWCHHASMRITRIENEKKKSVWIYFNKESIRMTHDSKRFLYKKFPSGKKMLTLKDSFGTQKLRLEDLYNKI